MQIDALTSMTARLYGKRATRRYRVGKAKKVLLP